MQKETIHTEQAPAAIGPYVQAVRVDHLIYTAGQGGLDPETGKMVEGGVQAQTKQVMKNLSAVLEAAGSDLAHVIKTNIYLRYIRDFAEMNEVYASFFDKEYPARTTTAASALPMAALVEIEMVALAIETAADSAEAEILEVDVSDTEIEGAEPEAELAPEEKKPKKKAAGKKKRKKKSPTKKRKKKKK